MITKIILHIKTILIHKWWVLYYSIIMNNTWRGLLHDLSKFHPEEFFELLKYVNGKTSPISKCKKNKGYSLAWLHHKSHNKHHFEYWLDIKNGEICTIEMPDKYIKEMVADWLAAGKTYKGKNFKIADEYIWLQANNNMLVKYLHPNVNVKIREILRCLEVCQNYSWKFQRNYFKNYFL